MTKGSIILSEMFRKDLNTAAEYKQLYRNFKDPTYENYRNEVKLLISEFPVYYYLMKRVDERFVRGIQAPEKFRDDEDFTQLLKLLKDNHDMIPRLDIVLGVMVQGALLSAVGDQVFTHGQISTACAVLGDCLYMSYPFHTYNSLFNQGRCKIETLYTELCKILRRSSCLDMIREILSIYQSKLGFYTTLVKIKNVELMWDYFYGSPNGDWALFYLLREMFNKQLLGCDVCGDLADRIAMFTMTDITRLERKRVLKLVNYCMFTCR